ncbi:hypothetical protein [Dyadobacter frigoris]|uniref:Uncharacterized protein n=1 Tax=Dyadobacter frigoris TaxID=2576211 RepID=A0A4U6CQS8_9BACT|nr:hypothetical protein [Dyadobacter frigoris]TKT86005.1 hypothetical protein FDK13_32930 [Dyadobacter frigoris]
MNLLHISGDDIALLEDNDFRDLIGLLCEADLRCYRLSTRNVLWGGHQDAKDGGLDVVVRANGILTNNEFLTNSVTSFQVKVPDMPPAEIIKEMMPGGKLRDEITNLAVDKGAYIIVSAKGSTSLTALKVRLAAMRKSIADLPIEVDFLDRVRVASWVRKHLFLVLWVRNKIGRPLNGWQPFGNWAYGNAETKYFLDENIRLIDRANPNQQGLSAEAGIDKLRSILHVPGSCIRLTGLSGVGKTKLVQTLFDVTVGNNALNPADAIYTDFSDYVLPDPKAMAEQINLLKARTILIIDNCSSALHNELVKVCHTPESSISLITIEYDVREDEPEDTNVFLLEPANDELITKLILSRFSNINQVDAGTISKFSGGNARIAMVLAKTIRVGETIRGLTDENLFNRLFYQRSEVDADLLLSAQILSLVYSFEGEDVDSDHSELKILSSLLSNNVDQLYRHIQELHRRDLIQSRGVWRAVLPHAIANRLAQRGLEIIPKNKLFTTMFQPGMKRLTISFTRRLSYLHDSIPAQDIVLRLLAEDGLLGDILSFDDLKMSMFENIASVLPEQALEVIEKSGEKLIEKFGLRKDMYHDRLVRLLRLIAYDPNLFTRSTFLMVSLSMSVNVSDKRNASYDLLKSLFPIKLSGTWAEIDARLFVIKNLWESGLEQKQEVSLLLLSACLETMRFGSVSSFSFGSRSRNYGYFPKSDNDIVDWFTKTIQLGTEFALSPFGKAENAKTLLADKLRGLWGQRLLQDVVEQTCLNIMSKIGYWREGWLAVGKTIMFNKMKGDSEDWERLESLHAKMKYGNLVEKVRTYLSIHPAERTISELEGNDSSALDFFETVVELGERLANDDPAFAILLPELVSGSSFSVFHLGRGLFNGSKEKEIIWQKLEEQFCFTNQEYRNVDILQGWLRSANEYDTNLLEEKLDYILASKHLNRYFVKLQCAVPIKKSGYLRVCQSLQEHFVDVNDYDQITWMLDFSSVSYNDLAELLVKIAGREGGGIVALEILHRHLRGSEPPLDESIKRVLISAARGILAQLEWENSKYSQNSFDYNLSQIVADCLNGEEASAVAENFVTNLIFALKQEHIYMHDFNYTVKEIINSQPAVVLDIFLLNVANFDWVQQKTDGFGFYEDRSILESFDDGELILWCDQEPSNRCELVLKIISFFYLDKFEKVAFRHFFWYLIENIVDVSKVFAAVESQIEPMSYSGNLADILEVRLSLFAQLCKSTNQAVSVWATGICSRLQAKILVERKRDLSNRRVFNGSFE